MAGQELEREQPAAEDEPHNRAAGGALQRQQQPGQPHRRLHLIKVAHVRAEKPAAGEYAAGEQGGKPRAAPAQPHEQVHAERPPPEVTDGVGEQGIRKAQPGEEQIGRIEHAVLNVGQEGAAKEEVGIPERDVPGGEAARGIGLQRIEIVDEIEPGEDAGVKQRVPKEERDEATQGEQGQRIR